ncbi:unnamed protein product [Heligmosomoides polygyrus]|uniref:DUF148 domain-containing protein n=1 Tax=Heligmosomoides polygyrus TaxID=6339 RepID=A0A183GPQ1_HELPZ|nr:unnamed protein product [Heligmosomoides polygyrus]
MKIAVLVLVFCAALCDAHRGRGRDEGGGRPGGHHRGPPPPPYLEDVTEEARMEYFTIVSNEDKTIADQKREILEWAQKYGIQEKVEEFNKKKESIGNEMKRNVTELIAALPSALERFSAIRENEDQTRSQQEEALRELKSADPKVHDVLRFIFHQFKPRHPHDKPGHQGIGGFGGPRGMSGEFGGEDMTGRPRGDGGFGGFGGFGGRPGFGGFQGWHFCLVLEKLYYSVKMDKKFSILQEEEMGAASARTKNSESEI